jgi:hypothetical protein
MELDYDGDVLKILFKEKDGLPSGLNTQGSEEDNIENNDYVILVLESLFEKENTTLNDYFKSSNKEERDEKIKILYEQYLKRVELDLALPDSFSKLSQEDFINFISEIIDLQFYSNNLKQTDLEKSIEFTNNPGLLSSIVNLYDKYIKNFDIVEQQIDIEEVDKLLNEIVLIKNLFSTLYVNKSVNLVEKNVVSGASKTELIQAEKYYD